MSWILFAQALQGDHTSDEALEAFYSSSQVALAELTSHLALQAHEEKSEVADISADTQESKASTVNVKTAFLAAAAGDNEILHKMLTEANVDPFHECNDDGYSLLMVAAGHNHLKTVRFLLDWHSPSIRKTATENESHAKDETLATADAEHSRQQETYAKEAALHLAKFTTSKNATSVLHVAAAFGGADILKAILDTKVDLTIDAYTNIVATAVQENRTENTAILAQRCMELGSKLCNCTLKGRCAGVRATRVLRCQTYWFPLCFVGCGEYAMGAASLACGLRRVSHDADSHVLS